MESIPTVGELRAQVDRFLLVLNMHPGYPGGIEEEDYQSDVQLAISELEYILKCVPPATIPGA
jgi:hypothetical protein